MGLDRSLNGLHDDMGDDIFNYFIQETLTPPRKEKENEEGTERGDKSGDRQKGRGRSDG
jgi:hypothetical protein